MSEPLKFSLPGLPLPPDHLQSPGRDLWTATLTEWQLTAADLLVLQLACETVDRLSQIQISIDKAGVTVRDPSGRIRAHPLMAAEAALRGVLLRAWAQLHLDDSEPPKIGRPPRGG
jgi:P27 family predicted phage terminase small subunit